MKANKALGQHFLKDHSVIQKICNDFADAAESILEIGPGPGILTKELAQHGLPFYAIEKDRRFTELLTPIVNMTLADALDIELDRFICDKDLTKLWLVSNLPYNIASPLLINFLKATQIQFMTLMFQKEVGQKLIANSMSSIKFLTNNYFNCNLLKKVPPGAFNPPPKVDSIIISFTKINTPIIPREEFEQLEHFLRQLFWGKRKQLGTTLKKFYSPEMVKNLLNKCDIDTKIRAEALVEDQIYRIYGEIKNWE